MKCAHNCCREWMGAHMGEAGFAEQLRRCTRRCSRGVVEDVQAQAHA
eukprot:CAMPEP_0115879480 /NCGR_PEP_ID=MMETSP0287-20121206/27342_1 /TAXON_ID=412157 /ORGANISM="Chrysochromulina rotalis, Strain UIO044" /LENGTH=46 /DNA_ID= /DNA_START= /DNA_END= /DNA_ORIENTATION=